jgi:hypothetical protein
MEKQDNMNNTEKTQENKPKFNTTFVNVHFEAMYKHSNKFEEAKAALTQLSFTIESLFWLVQKVAEGRNLLDLQTDSTLFRDYEIFGHLENVGALGRGLGLAVEEYANQLENNSHLAEANQAQSEAKETVLDLSEMSVEDLSQKLSDLMKNPNLPTSIYNCLADEFAQSSIDTNSPENILANLKKEGER